MSKKTRKFTLGLAPLLLALVGGGCFADSVLPASSLSAGDANDTDTDTNDSFSSVTITLPTITTVTTDPGTTGTDSGSTGDSPTEGDTEGDTDTTAGDVLPPEIFDVSLVPDPIFFNGGIEVSVLAEGEGVRLTYGAKQVQGETTIELEEVEPGVFKGEIAVLSGLDRLSNEDAKHSATLVAWLDTEQGLEESKPAHAPYSIKLLAPGNEGFWETGYGAGTGFGEVRAVGALPGNVGVLEFGMAGKGKSRCYIRHRTKGGAWEAYLELLPDFQCEAIDMKIGDDGTIHALMRRKTDSGWYWVLIKIPTWGAEPQELGYGSKNQVAYALAKSDDGTTAVCGSAPTAEPTDLSDAMIKIFRPQEFGQTKRFDYDPGGKAHTFSESIKDCAFTDKQTLLAVGDAVGKHEGINIDLTRRFDVFYKLLEDDGDLHVDDGKLATESFATAVDVASGYGAVIAGHICNGDLCKLEGKIWEIDLAGTLLSQTSIGLYEIPAFAPHDVVWSPANYVLVASGGLAGENTAFLVRAYQPGNHKPLWTYSRQDPNLLNVALTLAIGTYGEVYAGGWGADGYPAFAIIYG